MENPRVGPNLYLNVIFLAPNPLICYGSIWADVFYAMDITCEGIVLSCSWSNSTVIDLDREA